MSNKKNYDGMRYPSVDALLEKIDSKYKLAYAAAKRAKIIEQEEYTSYEDGKEAAKKIYGEDLKHLIGELHSDLFLSNDAPEDLKRYFYNDNIFNWCTYFLFL